jgi:hypothetical protein
MQAFPRRSTRVLEVLALCYSCTIEGSRLLEYKRYERDLTPLHTCHPCTLMPVVVVTASTAFNR